MLNMRMWLRILSVFTYLCQVLSEHPCGESPHRRFASLTRILNDMYPGRDINPAMALLRESNPEVYRRLQPVVAHLQSEWRLYTECLTMVDTGYFKRSDPSYLTHDEMESSRPSKKNSRSRTDVFWGNGVDNRSGFIDLISGVSTLNEIPPNQDSSS